MGYMHINNLYKDQRILHFRECFALEKIHGTSAHVGFGSAGGIYFGSGGEKHERFVKLFDLQGLPDRFQRLGHAKVCVFGEAYGGSQQRQAYRYGPTLRFVVFEVRIGDMWLDVPAAHKVATECLGFEFVHFERVPTDIPALDAARDAPSEQARRNGMGGDKPREGVVLRPLSEYTDKRGERVIAKHKRPSERETKTPRELTVDPARLLVLQDAEAIAEEWVTPIRLAHVLDKLGPEPLRLDATGRVVSSMLEDIMREAKGEIVDSKEARKAIGAMTAKLLRSYLDGNGYGSGYGGGR